MPYKMGKKTTYGKGTKKKEPTKTMKSPKKK
jgi:hypothetical protein